MMIHIRQTRLCFVRICITHVNTVNSDNKSSSHKERKGGMSDRQLLMTDTFKLLRPRSAKMTASVSLCCCSMWAKHYERVEGNTKTASEKNINHKTMCRHFLFLMSNVDTSTGINKHYI